MEVGNWPTAGEMTSRIEFFENVSGTDEFGTVGKDAPESLGTYSAQRIDGRPGTDDDGRLADVAMVTYRMRFVRSLFDKGGSLIVNDFDGEWQVKGPIQVMGGRNRYMQFNCQKRG